MNEEKQVTNKNVKKIHVSNKHVEKNHMANMYRANKHVTKYVLVGTGNRMIEMFIKPLIGKYSTNNRIVAIYDINEGRARYVSKLIPYEVRVCDDFDIMVNEVDADVCIIATNDVEHYYYIKKHYNTN